MELKRLRIRNFLGIGEGKIAFDKSGVVFVEGVNHDSPSSISNGAGKSSLFEALFWVLYGKTKRGLVGDSVINNTAGMNCRVELEFDNCLVVRTRKDEELGNALLLRQRTEEGQWRDLTLGTGRNTQGLLEDTIKMSELTFSKVAYFGQADVKGFAGLRDGELKKVLEQALGLGFFVTYQEKVREHRAALEGEYKALKSGRDLAERDSLHVREKIDLLVRSMEEYYERVAGERSRLETDLEVVEQELRAAEQDAEAALSGIERELESLAAKREEMVPIEEQCGRAKERHRDLDRRLAVRQAENTALASRIRILEREIKAIEAKVGKPCETCGKVYEAQDLERASAHLCVKRDEEILVYEAGKDYRVRIEKDVLEAGESVERLKENLASFERTRARIMELKTRYAEWGKMREKRRADLLGKRGEIGRRLGELGTGDPKAKKLLEAAKCEEARLEETLRDLAAQLEKLAGEVETAGLLEEIMGNGGMKSYVFDAITPQLNKLIDRNIKMLDDIDIEVSTVTKLKSGEFREKFSIGVRNRHGATVFEGNSGGEMQKINLAISLAINSLLRTVAEGSINAIFLDECFENLDEGSSERVMELIGTIEAPNVFIITHRQDVKALVPAAIKVEKRKGRASIHLAVNR